MPSDDRVERALEAVAGDRDAFRSAVAGAVDEVRSLLEKERAPAGAASTGASLGPLAEGRIDAGRFASLFESSEEMDPDAVELVEGALDVLSDLHGSGDDLFRLDLDPGRDPGDAAADALARLGRAFGAARTVDLVRSGRYRAEDHGDYLESFPHRMWNGEERGIAPPLVLRLRGSDLRPAALGDLLDGRLHVVLVVDGEAPPASLVRLITPGTLVIQDEDPGALSEMEDHDGPAAAALFPEESEGVARFVHDPAREGGLSARLSVSHLPDEDSLRPVGGITRDHQAEELAQLRALHRAAAAAEPSENGGPPDAEDAGETEPADRLAGWLLRQSGLDDVGG